MNSATTLFLAIEQHDPCDPCSEDNILNPWDFLHDAYYACKTKDDAMKTIKRELPPKKKLWEDKKNNRFYHKWKDPRTGRWERTYYSIIEIKSPL